MVIPPGGLYSRHATGNGSAQRVHAGVKIVVDNVGGSLVLLWQPQDLNHRIVRIVQLRGQPVERSCHGLASSAVAVSSPLLHGRGGGGGRCLGHLRLLGWLGVSLACSWSAVVAAWASEEVVAYDVLPDLLEQLLQEHAGDGVANS